MLNDLRELIARTYQCVAKGGGHLLSEPAEPGFPVTKLKGGKQVLLCKFDTNTATLLPFLNPHVPTTHAMADYVAFVEDRDKIYVYTIELSNKKAKTRQRKPTEDFIRYIEATARRIYTGGQQFLYRYLLVRNIPVPKGATKPGKFFDAQGIAHWAAGEDLNLVIYSLP